MKFRNITSSENNQNFTKSFKKVQEKFEGNCANQTKCAHYIAFILNLLCMSILNTVLHSYDISTETYDSIFCCTSCLTKGVFVKGGLTHFGLNKCPLYPNMQPFKLFKQLLLLPCCGMVSCLVFSFCCRGQGEGTPTSSYKSHWFT